MGLCIFSLGFSNVADAGLLNFLTGAVQMGSGGVQFVGATFNAVFALVCGESQGQTLRVVLALSSLRNLWLGSSDMWYGLKKVIGYEEHPSVSGARGKVIWGGIDVVCGFVPFWYVFSCHSPRGFRQGEEYQEGLLASFIYALVQTPPGVIRIARGLKEFVDVKRPDQSVGNLLKETIVTIPRDTGRTLKDILSISLRMYDSLPIKRIRISW